MNKHPRPIGFLCGGTAWGGLEMNVLRLAGWLRDRGWTIILYTSDNSPIFQHATQQDFTVRHIKCSTKLQSILNSAKLARLIELDRISIMVLHTNKQMLLAVLAKLLSRQTLKLVYQQHMHLGGSKRDWFHKRVYGQLDSWIAPLEMFRERVGKQTTIPPSRITVIPFGLEIDQFQHDLPTKESARAKLSLPSDGLLIGLIGRIDKLKGQDILIKAISIMQASGTSVQVLIMGDPTSGEGELFSEYLRVLARQIHVAEYIHFRPHQTDVAMAYAAMDIFTLTTYSETYGMVTIEAMASGLAVVGTDDGGTTEIIDHEVNGLRVKPGDEQELARALIRLAQDDQLRLKLGNQAKEDATALYSHKIQCNQLEKLFYSLLVDQ